MTMFDHELATSSSEDQKNGVTETFLASNMPRKTSYVASEGTGMERRVGTELKDLKGRILAMAGYVEQAIDRAVQALQERNSKKLEEVYQLESKINQSHIDVDNACLGVLARQAPVAADLRLILAIIKINTDLERMGDQAVNISHNAERYLREEAVEIAQVFPQMAALVRTMVRDSLDSFVNADIELARKVLKSDDAVDEFKKNTIEKLMQVMKSEPTKIDGALDLILIARNLERMADHATNIAEDVIFVSTGEDVRHGGGKKGS